MSSREQELLSMFSKAQETVMWEFAWHTLYSATTTVNLRRFVTERKTGPNSQGNWPKSVQHLWMWNVSSFSSRKSTLLDRRNWLSFTCLNPLATTFGDPNLLSFVLICSCVAGISWKQLFYCFQCDGSCMVRTVSSPLMVIYVSHW